MVPSETMQLTIHGYFLCPDGNRSNHVWAGLEIYGRQTPK